MLPISTVSRAFSPALPQPQPLPTPSQRHRLPPIPSLIGNLTIQAGRPPTQPAPIASPTTTPLPTAQANSTTLHTSLPPPSNTSTNQAPWQQVCSARAI